MWLESTLCLVLIKPHYWATISYRFRANEESEDVYAREYMSWTLETYYQWKYRKRWRKSVRTPSSRWPYNYFIRHEIVLQVYISKIYCCDIRCHTLARCEILFYSWRSIPLAPPKTTFLPANTSNTYFLRMEMALHSLLLMHLNIKISSCMVFVNIWSLSALLKRENSSACGVDVSWLTGVSIPRSHLGLCWQETGTTSTCTT